MGKFLGMFQEADGKASFSRVSSVIVLGAWLTWVSFCVFTTRMLPTGMWEISTVVGTLYGLNKITEAIKVNTNTNINE